MARSCWCRAVRVRPPRAPVYDAKAPLSSYDVHKAVASQLVVKHSLVGPPPPSHLLAAATPDGGTRFCWQHKTLANQMKEKLLDYVRVDGDSQVFLLTDQRVVIVSSDEGKPLSIPLHREPRRPLAALPLSAFADRHRLTEITSSSKGSVDTTIEVVYKNAQKKSVKMPIVIAGATSSPDEDRRKAEELAMTLMLASVEAQERFRERGR